MLLFIFELVFLVLPLFCYQIETLEEFEKVSTSEERQSFVEKLDEVYPSPWTTKNYFTDKNFDLSFLHSVRCKIGCIQMVKMLMLQSFKSVLIS